MTFQELIRKLDDYWSAQGCAILEPYDTEVGAGTMHPATTLRVLGPESWNVAYVQPSRRPADGRYTRNPQRSQRYYQYQVIMKPSPDNIVDLYMGSLDYLGIDTSKNDIRLVEDDWESQAAGASGVGWEVWINGAEVTQFTFFQQMGGVECNPVCAEITYGPERLCLMINNTQSFWEGLDWNETTSYKTVDFQAEMQSNVYNFEIADTDMLFKMFDMYEAESKRVIESEVFWDETRGILTSEPPVLSGAADGSTDSIKLKFDDDKLSGLKRLEPYERPSKRSDVLPPVGSGPKALVYPALDLALKCSHVFNLLDARGAVSVTERAKYINRIRARVRACCLKHVEQFKQPAAN